MSHSMPPLSRRALLCRGGLAALASTIPALSFAQGQPPTRGDAGSQLPLKTTGLEHLGTVVPDVSAAAKFYSRVFNPDLYKEKDPPLRYYVTLGVGYLALGTRANQPHAFFDHFCALVEDYDAAAMAAQLRAEGLPAGRFGIIPDPDGIGLQLLPVPGGLAKSTEPAGRLVDAGALVRPQRLGEVVLRVSDLEKSLQFYRRFFGPETPPQHRGGSSVFQVSDTRLVVEAGAAAGSARVDRIAINVDAFDHKKVSHELTQLGARVGPHDKHGLLFTDPFGLTVQLHPGATS